MFENLTWHEFIIGILAIILVVAITLLIGFNHTVPAELWAMATSLIGVIIGIQVPSGTHIALLQQNAATTERLASSLTRLTNLAEGGLASSQTPAPAA